MMFSTDYLRLTFAFLLVMLVTHVRQVDCIPVPEKVFDG